eukprot:11353758-Prorocentrum_lima.AAC.1
MTKVLQDLLCSPFALEGGGAWQRHLARELEAQGTSLQARSLEARAAQAFVGALRRASPTARKSTLGVPLDEYASRRKALLL